MSHSLETTLSDAASPPDSELETGVKSPARRHILSLATALGGAAFAGALCKPASADLVAAVGKIFYLDPIVLNFAFELEELEADFFTRATSSTGFAALSERQQNVLYSIAAQDKMHFEQLGKLRSKRGDEASRGTNRSASRRPRMFRFGNLDTSEQLLNTALDLKENSLFAYHGAVGLLKDRNLLMLAAAVAGVEGRHAAALRESMGLDPVPAPYEGALEAQISGRKLARYGFVGGASL